MPEVFKDLKPCPFCGKEARPQATEQGLAIVCTNLYECGCRTPYFKDWSDMIGWDDWRKAKPAIEKAVEAWNRRTEGDGDA